MSRTPRIERRMLAFLVWNAAIAVWALGGHWGVRGSGGEGKVLVVVTVVVLWVFGDLLYLTVRWVAGWWRRRET